MAGLGVTVATTVDAEMMILMSGRAVRATVEVAKGGSTGFSANLVEHLTPVEVNTPAVNVNALAQDVAQQYENHKGLR